MMARGKARGTNTSDAEISGVLLMSYTAIRPLYISWPSLYDKARRSPEASQAIFSMPRLTYKVKRQQYDMK